MRGYGLEDIPNQKLVQQRSPFACLHGDVFFECTPFWLFYWTTKTIVLREFPLQNVMFASILWRGSIWRRESLTNLLHPPPPCWIGADEIQGPQLLELPTHLGEPARFMESVVRHTRQNPEPIATPPAQPGTKAPAACVGIEATPLGVADPHGRVVPNLRQAAS